MNTPIHIFPFASFWPVYLLFSLGVAGVNTIINGLTQKRKIAHVRAEAAKQYLRLTGGYSGGIEDHITKALRLNKLIP